MKAAAAAAASGALSAASKMVSGDGLPFETGAEVTSFAGKSVWRMHSGKKTNPEGNKEDVTIFLCDVKGKSDRELTLARNAVKRLRTMKHPYLLKCLDAGEKLDQKGGGTIYLVTEPVMPVEDVLESLHETPGGLAWGVYTLAAAIKFLNMDCNIVHGQVCLASLFVDKGMDWKLGGFELLVEAANADEALRMREALEDQKRWFVLQQDQFLARQHEKVLKGHREAVETAEAIESVKQTKRELGSEMRKVRE